MRILSINHASSLTFNFVELEKKLPSICVSVTIENEGFGSFLPMVWIEWDVIRKFLDATKQYSYKQDLATKLVSMTPDEMELTFHKENAEIGTLDFNLSKWAYVDKARRKRIISLSGGFEFNMKPIDDLREFFLQFEHEFL